MRKVLVIAYHFPPDAAMGAARPSQVSKYLPEYVLPGRHAAEPAARCAR